MTHLKVHVVIPALNPAYQRRLWIQCECRNRLWNMDESELEMYSIRLITLSIGSLRRWLRKVPDFQQDGIFKFVKSRDNCTKMVDVVSKNNITVELTIYI
jgi:hypothetical protein